MARPFQIRERERRADGDGAPVGDAVTQAVKTPRERTLDAARMIAARYGVPDQVRQLERAEDGTFDPLAVALLAEAVAALLLEVKPTTGQRAKVGT